MTAAGQELHIRTNDEYTEETVEDQHGLVVHRRLDLYLQPTESEDGDGPLESLRSAASSALPRPMETTGRFNTTPRETSSAWSTPVAGFG